MQFMARFTVIWRWTPEKVLEVRKRYGEFLKGQRPPAIMEAYKRLKVIAWEFPAYYGQLCEVAVFEGEETDLSTLLRDWMDLTTTEILPSVPKEILDKLYPP
jgi:hypothetical protein